MPNVARYGLPIDFDSATTPIGHDMSKSRDGHRSNYYNAQHCTHVVCEWRLDLQQDHYISDVTIAAHHAEPIGTYRYKPKKRFPTLDLY